MDKRVIIESRKEIFTRSTEVSELSCGNGKNLSAEGESLARLQWRNEAERCLQERIAQLSPSNNVPFTFENFSTGRRARFVKSKFPFERDVLLEEEVLIRRIFRLMLFLMVFTILTDAWRTIS